MLLNPKHEDRLVRLDEQLQRAVAPTPDLMSYVMTDVYVRLPVLNHTDSAKRINQLIRSGAWTDAILALIELELPAWRLRRLTYDNGEWHCSLSRHRELPIDLDDTADASHEALELAILGAFIEAQRQNLIPNNVSLTSVPQIQCVEGHAICCDNFA